MISNFLLIMTSNVRINRCENIQGVISVTFIRSAIIFILIQPFICDFPNQIPKLNFINTNENQNLLEQNIHTQSKENGSINEREFVQHKNAGIKPNVISTEKSNNETLVNCSFIPKSESKNINLVGLLINILICIYSFLGITIVCQNYFVTSMSRIYEDFKLSEDIMGATLMAAGSSAPELATVIIAVFFSEDDIGISDVIGSAVFNMLFVISLCALFTHSALHLNWWPLVRNCFSYIISITIMLVVISNEQVSWIESLLLIGAYILYYIALYYNEFLETWINTLPLPFNKMQNEDTEEANVNYISLEDRKSYMYVSTNKQNNIILSNGKSISSIQQTYESDSKLKTGGLANETNSILLPHSNILEQLKYYFISPVSFICRITIPDWQKERFHNLYLLTFLVSFLWISVYSYIMIRMITIIGEMLRIPSTVMGLTLVAAGVSVPDAVTSLKVIKEGYADMAVSNVMGSNIFDILICLGVPWFLRTALIKPGSYIRVYSKGMIYSTVLLLSTVILLITAIHWNGWKLDKKFGTILLLSYIVFMTTAIFYELFANVTNRECEFF